MPADELVRTADVFKPHQLRIDVIADEAAAFPRMDRLVAQFADVAVSGNDDFLGHHAAPSLVLSR